MSHIHTYPDLNTMFARAANQFAGKPAFTVCLPNGLCGTLTYAEVERQSLLFASFLSEELGLKPNERVAVHLPNTLAFPVCAIGILRAGCVLVNINSQSSESELIRTLKESGARLLVSLDLFADKFSNILSETSVRTIVTTRLAEFMPAIMRLLVQANLKLSRRIPKPRVPVTRLTDALDDTVELGRICRWVIANPATPDSIAALQHTSGTTGPSRGTILTHANFTANMEQVRQLGHPWLVPGREVVLTATPLSHSFAFTINFLMFHSLGAHNILIPQPQPVSSLRPAFEHFHITWMTGANALFKALTNEAWFRKNPPRHFKFAIAEGAPLQSVVAQKWHEIVGSDVLEAYGLSEASSVVCMNPLNGTSRIGTIGKPLADTEIAIIDDSGNQVLMGETGELAVRGPQVMKGYWNNPRETELVLRNGWLLTGDLACVEDDGFCRVRGRKKEMILVSGFSVYPDEVENVVAAMPGVAEVAIIGVPNEQRGERVHACVIPTNKLNPPSLEELRAHCRHLLSSYKIPTSLEIVEAIPKSSCGKVARRDVLAAALERERMRMPKRPRTEAVPGEKQPVTGA